MMTLDEALQQMERWSITLANHAKRARVEVFDAIHGNEKLAAGGPSRTQLARMNLRDVEQSLGEVTAALNLVQQAIDATEPKR